MREKIIKYLFYKFFNLYMEGEGPEEVLKEIKIYVFDFKYAEFSTEDKKPSEIYLDFIGMASKGTGKKLEIDPFFRQLRKDKTWQYKRIENIIAKKRF